VTGNGGGLAWQTRQLSSGGMEIDVGVGRVLTHPRGRAVGVGCCSLWLADLLGQHGMLPPTKLGGWQLPGLPGSPDISGKWLAIR